MKNVPFPAVRITKTIGATIIRFVNLSGNRHGGWEQMIRTIGMAVATALAAISAITANTANADGKGDEQKFLSSVRQLPTYTWPNGPSTTDAQMLAGGYRACAVMDQNPGPGNGMTAAKMYYNGPNAMYREVSGAAWDFMAYSASYLCYRNGKMYPQVSEEGIFAPGGTYGPPSSQVPAANPSVASTPPANGGVGAGIGTPNQPNPTSTSSQSSLLPLVLPTGSTGSRSGSWETWKTSTPFANAVQTIRPQLPIGKSFLGLPWCSGEPFGTMQMWDWKSSTRYVMVSVNDRGEITIFNGPDTSGRADCD